MERIVLRDTVTPDDIDDARLRQGFRVASLVTARAGIPAQQVLLTADRRHVLHFIEDGQLQVRYVVVSGPDEKATRRVIEDALPTVDDAALSELLARRDPRGLALAALMCPEARPDALLAFDQAFVDRAESTRAFALVASAYARWPALRPRVTRVAGTDPSPAIRERALLILDAWPS